MIKLLYISLVTILLNNLFAEEPSVILMIFSFINVLAIVLMENKPNE